MGALCMSASPDDGIVDSDCKVHTLTNLYVAGSGVFPTTGHGDPTLTIVALALRLADHLRAKPNVPAGGHRFKSSRRFARRRRAGK
jgi:choline dehydrogenase-like flavoprotein